MTKANVDATPLSSAPPDSNQPISLPTVSILDVAIHAVDFAATLDQIGLWLAARQQDNPSLDKNLLGSFGVSWKVATCHQICTVNPEFLIHARRDSSFAALLARVDLRVPDGVGVLLAARLYGVHLRERVTGSDGLFRICERAARAGWRVYLLGVGAGVAAQTATLLQQQFPALRVAGTFSGSPNDDAWPEIAQRLHTAQPDILFVAYGHPRQDFWIDRHRHELPATVAMGVGGAFDFAAGVTQRAPQWMRRLGLEWLHRLIHQPWRWRRMLALPLFVLLVLKERMLRR